MKHLLSVADKTTTVKNWKGGPRLVKRAAVTEQASADACDAEIVLDSLNTLVKENILTITDAKKRELEIKEKRIRRFYGIDSEKFGFYAADDRAFVHIGEQLRRRFDRTSDLITARNSEELILKLYDVFFLEKAETLNEAFEVYHSWRLSVGTKDKTLKEDKFTWNRFFRDSLGSTPVKDITAFMLRDRFLEMTANNAISKTCFITARGVIDGVFRRCLEAGTIPFNPVLKVDYSTFKKRFKPIEKKKGLHESGGCTDCSQPS